MIDRPGLKGLRLVSLVGVSTPAGGFRVAAIGGPQPRVVRVSIHPSHAARLRVLVVPSDLTGVGIHGDSKR